tara:strand:- start:141 stop:1106 length:966 start_codon:yes stop_codon:yes gene_type:complete
MNNKPILVVAGEPNSIFLEIFFKSLKKNKFKKPIVLIVSKSLLLKQMEKLNERLNVNLIDSKRLDLQTLNNKKINIINVNYKFKKVFEKISDNSNEYLTKCFQLATLLLKSNKFSGLINGPISKKNFLKDRYLGITEYLAEKTNRKNKAVMLIYNKKLSVSPITTHLPLKEVHKHITKKKIINQVKSINKFYLEKFKLKPNIAITGLNPHCESNYKTSEEERIIIPAIKYLIKKKYKVHGPFAADTVFLRDQYNNYDVIIGMYHDQVLAPIKTLFHFDAINITIGLPFIRISPDHGPNEKMLGKNLSDPKSLIEALKFLDK